MHARLDHMRSTPHFSVTACKPRYWSAFSGAREHSINSN